MSAPLEPIKTNSMPLPPTSPTRPKHLTTRSITEINAPPSIPRIPHSHGHSHGHSGHSKHHHPHIHHRHKDRDREGEGGIRTGIIGAGGVGSGVGIGQGVIGSRSEGHTPSESRVASRRESLWDGGGSGDGAGGFGSGGAGGRRERVVREGEVREERERGVLRATFVISFLCHLPLISQATCLLAKSL